MLNVPDTWSFQSQIGSVAPPKKTVRRRTVHAQHASRSRWKQGWLRRWATEPTPMGWASDNCVPRRPTHGRNQPIASDYCESQRLQYECMPLRHALYKKGCCLNKTLVNIKFLAKVRVRNVHLSTFNNEYCSNSWCA